MNKTVNINLGGMIFHIDENAYHKLQNYLNAVKTSFAGASGEDEIIADIEIRIAELFTEKQTNERQVISTKEVDDVIEIMGQPEDYMVDSDIFEEDTQSKSNNQQTSQGTYRKIFRDSDNRYIGGVSSGLSHYLGIDALWIRLGWLALLFFFGTGILAYVILWILIPEASTTAEKIAMKGDPVNISNIEKKIREELGNAADSVKNADYQKAQNGVSKFFDTIGNIFMSIFKVFGKFIGIILIIAGISGLASLVIGILVSGSINFFNYPITDELAIYDYASGFPYWLLGLLIFFIAGIPLFFLAYLGLKILSNNLKSIGNIAKFSLLGVWILSVIGLSAFGAKTGLKSKERAVVIIKDTLPIYKNDKIRVKMVSNELYPNEMYRDNDVEIVYDEEDKKHIFNQDIRLIVKSTQDSTATIRIKKKARGTTHAIARKRASDIDYEYTLDENTLALNNYLLMSPELKYNEQDLEITLFLPVGSVLYAEENTHSFHLNSESYNDILISGDENKYLEILDGNTTCISCVKKTVNYSSENNENVIVDEDGIRITSDDGKVIVDENGLDINLANDGKHFEMKIDENGLKIKSDQN